LVRSEGELFAKRKEKVEGDEGSLNLLLEGDGSSG
jgi:hypothetical protein